MKEFDLAGRFGAVLVLTGALALFGCKSNQSSQNAQNNPSDQPAADQTQESGDPANANVVPISNTTTGTAAPSGEADQYSPAQYNENNGYGEDPETYAPQPPPELPQYDQPPCPQDGDIWTPGYWAYAQPSGYYWVPGAWVQAPYTGALWTPAYWGWRDGRYAFYRGYWGRHIGFYGGINYGFGYVGTGYQGGYWRGNEFAYNTAVNHVDTMRVHNVYNYRITNVSETRISYNGGSGGVRYQPRVSEVYAIREEHTAPMTAQLQMRQTAMSNRATFYNVNHGHPTTAVETRAVTADRNVRPPAEVNYARGERPAEPARATPEQQRPESRTTPEPQRPDSRTTPEQHRPESRPAPEQHRPESRPTPEAQRPESRQAPQQNRREATPAPVERKPETRPAPPQHKPETRQERRPKQEPQREPKKEPQHEQR